MVQWAPNQPLSFAEPATPSEPPAERQPAKKRRRSQEQAPAVKPPVPSLGPTSVSLSEGQTCAFEPVVTPPSSSSSPSSSASWPAAGARPHVTPRDAGPTSRAQAAFPHVHRSPALLPLPGTPSPSSSGPRDAPHLPYRGTPSPRPAPGPPDLHPRLQPHPPPMSPPSPRSPGALTTQDIATLAARFTNKPVPVPHGYEQEARTTLEASQSEPAVRHALASLRSLYRTLEDHGHEFPHGRLAVPTVYHGLQEYHNAIVNLTGKLSVMDRRSCEVALVCCRLFISIETMQRDYVSVADHYVRGMRIMHEAATRPYLDARGNVIPTQNSDFPKIDSFVIKLFMSPDRMAPACTATIRALATRRLTPYQSMRIHRLARSEVRAARLKARLLLISELCLHHFDNVARLRPGADAAGVVGERGALLAMLDGVDIEGRDGERDLGPYHGRFLLLYHCALRIAVTLSLWAPTEDIAELQPVFDRVAEVSRLVI